MQVTRYPFRRRLASGRPSCAYHGRMVRRPAQEPAGRDADAASPLAAALARIGDRWSPRIIEALLAGPLRFGDLQTAITGIAPNILADRLRRLEADGLLAATAYVERPPRFEYRITTEGRALAGALRLLADWGAAITADSEHEPLRHDSCGTSLEAHWFCPTCGEIVAPGAATEGRRV